MKYLVMGALVGLLGLAAFWPKESECIQCMGLCTSHMQCLLGCHCAMDGEGSGWCVNN